MPRWRAKRAPSAATLNDARAGHWPSIGLVGACAEPVMKFFEDILGMPLVAERSANAVTTYLDDLSAIDGPHSFATPVALGFTQPQGVCDVF